MAGNEVLYGNESIYASQPYSGVIYQSTTNAPYSEAAYTPQQVTMVEAPIVLPQQVTTMPVQSYTVPAPASSFVRSTPMEDWEASKVKAELSYRTNENNDLRKSIAELDARAAKMAREAERAASLEAENRSLRHSLEEERRLMLMKLEDKERLHNLSNEEVARLHVQLNEATRKVQPFQSEVDRLKQELNERDEVLKQQQAKITALMGEEGRRAQDYEALQSKLKMVDEEAAMAQKDNEKLLTLLNDQRERNTNLIKEIHPLQNENLDLRERLRRLQMTQTTEPEIAGVGMLLGKSSAVDAPSHIYVLKLVPGGPADQCGQIEVNDILYAVDGASVFNCDLNDVFAKIRGPEGSPVTLELSRRGKDGEARYRLTLTRRNTGVTTPLSTYQPAQWDAPIPPMPSSQVLGDTRAGPLHAQPSPSDPYALPRDPFQEAYSAARASDRSGPASYHHGPPTHSVTL